MDGRLKLVALTAVVAGVAAAGTAAIAGGGDGIREQLTGYQEDPQAISTTGKGTFQARIDDRRQEISYRLRYADLEGGVTAGAHPLRWASAERRDQRVPVHEPGERAGRNSGLSGRPGHGHRHDPSR